MPSSSRWRRCYEIARADEWHQVHRVPRELLALALSRPGRVRPSSIACHDEIQDVIGWVEADVHTVITSLYQEWCRDGEIQARSLTVQDFEMGTAEDQVKYVYTELVMLLLAQIAEGGEDNSNIILRESQSDRSTSQSSSIRLVNPGSFIPHLLEAECLQVHVQTIVPILLRECASMDPELFTLPSSTSELSSSSSSLPSSNRLSCSQLSQSIGVTSLLLLPLRHLTSALLDVVDEQFTLPLLCSILCNNPTCTSQVGVRKSILRCWKGYVCEKYVLYHKRSTISLTSNSQLSVFISLDMSLHSACCWV